MGAPVLIVILTNGFPTFCSVTNLAAGVTSLRWWGVKSHGNALGWFP